MWIKQTTSINKTHSLQTPGICMGRSNMIKAKKPSFRNTSRIVLRLMQIRFNAEIPFSDVLNPQSADTHRQEPGSKLVRRIQFLFIYMFYNVIVIC